VILSLKKGFDFLFSKCKDMKSRQQSAFNCKRKFFGGLIAQGWLDAFSSRRGKGVQVPRCPATVSGTKPTGKQQLAISGQQSAKDKGINLRLKAES
jgi:hypothetical protein